MTSQIKGDYIFEKGDKIQAWFLWNGLPCDKQRAGKYLKLKQIYTVLDYAVSDPFDMVKVTEYPNIWFNRIHFMRIQKI